jgi:3D (Asp-Asp-Asp) domain-containing protein
VIGYGTKIVVRTLQTPQGPVEYWRVVRMRVTSYTAASSGKASGDPGYGITASGRPAGTGIVAIDRSVVPFRSYVYVPGYGIGFAGDTGGGVRGRWIDLGYDEDEYVPWSGYVDVYYLTPVPSPDDINYLIPQGLP